MIKDISREEYLFTEEEFNILSEETAMLTNENDEVRILRKSIQQKLLDINAQILPMISKHKLDIHNHRVPRNITSQPFPYPRNYWKVNWICVRYGRSPRDIKLLNLDSVAGEDDEFGFLKFQCFQVDVLYTGVEVSIFHSLPNNSFDRGYVHSKIDDTEFKQKLIDVINNIKGYGFKWYAGDACFDFDTNKAEDFIDFYKKNDTYHKYSSITLAIPRWDKRLLKDHIAENIFEIIDQLYPLFQLMKWPLDGGNV